MRFFPWMLVLTLTSPAFAQAPATEIRVTGLHRVAGADTPDTAKQLARHDAERKTLLAVVAQLQDLAEVKALQLRPNHLAAYVAAAIDIPEPSARSSPANKATVYQADVSLPLSVAETVRRLRELRRDQEACMALAEHWAQVQTLDRQLLDQAARLAKLTPRDASQTLQDLHLTLTTLRVKHLSARATAALARIEERPIGGRGPSADGREQAKRLAETALAFSPDLPDAHYSMGDVLFDAGQIEAAEGEYRKALLAVPDSSSGHTKLANALIRRQQLPEAGVELRAALRIDPTSVQAHSDLGWVLRSQNATDAIAEYQEALRLDPDFIDAHNGLAVTLARQGRLPEAVAQFREIVRIDPDSAIGFYNLSYALADMDQDDESAAALREVVRINPNHYNARYNLGELFRLEGKFDESVKQFREYLRLAPEGPQNRRNIDRAKDFVAKFENQ